MEYFRSAVEMTLCSPKYFRPEELTAVDFSKKVRVIGAYLTKEGDDFTHTFWQLTAGLAIALMPFVICFHLFRHHPLLLVCRSSASCQCHPHWIHFLAAALIY